MKHIVNGLTLVCLMVSLTGCGKRIDVQPPIRITETVYEKVQVPAELLAFCEEPDLDKIETTGDLERVAIESVASLASCNVDKAKIREWQSE